MSLVILATLTFIFLKFLPGTPFDEESRLHPVVYEELLRQWHLTDPWYLQLFHYFLTLGQGGLGVSLVHPERSVLDILLGGFSKTLVLNLWALLLVTLGSFVLSLLSVRFRHTWIEGAIHQFNLALVSLPSLFLGPLLIYIFGFYFNLLPVALLSSPSHYILPLMTLSARPLASLSRLLANSLNENVKRDYVRTAKAKGLDEWHILIYHVLRNSWVPFLSYLGPMMLSIFSGSVLVEMLFALPGMGSEFLSALNDRDFTVVAGATLFYGFLLMLANSILDVIIKNIDPRMRDGA